MFGVDNKYKDTNMNICISDDVHTGPLVVNRGYLRFIGKIN